VLFISIT